MNIGLTSLHDLLSAHLVVSTQKLTSTHTKVVLIALAALSFFVLSYFIISKRKLVGVEKKENDKPILIIKPAVEKVELQESQNNPLLKIIPETKPKIENSLTTSAEKAPIPRKSNPKKDNLIKKPEPIKPKSVELPNGDIWISENPVGMGTGKMINSKDEFQEGRFENGLLAEGKISSKYTQRIGSKEYRNFREGNFQKGLLYGTGKTSDYGILRGGNFVGGKLHGVGKITFEDGISWQGTFIENKFNGAGTVSFRWPANVTGRFVVDPAIFQEIFLVLEFMLHGDNNLTGISICVGGIEESLPPAQCQYVHETIKGFAKLNENIDVIKKIFQEEGLPKIFRATNLPEFAFHSENKRSLISTIEYTVQSFAEQYLKHKTEGTLPNFLMEAFDPANHCFEARHEYLLDYKTK